MDITVSLTIEGVELFYLCLKNYQQRAEPQKSPFEQAFEPRQSKPKFPPETGDLSNYRN